MKRYSVLLVLMLVSTTCIMARPQEVFSRTYMYTRPACYNLAMYQQLWHNFVYNKKGPVYGGFEVIGYYQPSVKRAKNARYFLIERKNSLLVAGDAVTDLLVTRDIRAEWVNLPSDFQGKLSVCPEQKQGGLTLQYNQDLSQFFDLGIFKDWAFGIELPFIWVENNMNFSQFDVQCSQYDLVGTCTQPNIICAFNQPGWCFAKIPCGKQKRFDLAEIRFTLGRAMMNSETFQLASFTEVSIPTAKHPEPEYLFDPVVGNGRHFTLGGAVLTQVLLNRDYSKASWSFFLNLEGLFLVRNKQHRTFDLMNKPWSRYMLYTRKNSPPGSTVPGVNVLTLPVTVRPFGQADFSMGLRVKGPLYEFECGYNLWGHGGETVRLRSQLQAPFNKCGGGLNEFGIAGAGTITVQGQQVAASASRSTIAQREADDATFVTIKTNDIDLHSAQAGSALNHKLHFAMGLENTGEGMNAFAGFGGWIEFPQKNSPLQTWGLWFKFGGTF